MSDVFCKILSSKPERVLGETKHFAIIKEAAPVSKGHCLIVSKRHSEDAFTLSKEEWADFREAIALAKEITKDNQPDGYNIGMNCGETAGQSQFHFHAHFIPRYKGDVADPLGGVRNILGNNIPPKK